MDEERSTGEAGLAQTLQQMKRFVPESDYYALTLGANRRGRPFWGAQTHWVGQSERHPGWEISAASLMDPAGMARVWTEMGQGWVAVHDDTSLAVYLRVGGNALVEKGLADARLPEVVGPANACMTVE